MADDALLTLSTELGAALKQRKWSLALAESCTGGWAAQIVTAIPGSSGWFDRGFVTYSNAAKIDLLGVAATTLESHGAVSERTAREMALGALHHSQAQVTAAITGIAGPDGGSVEKPVGTVWFAWATPSCCKTEMHHFEGNRESIRRQAVETALQGVILLAKTHGSDD
jgi:nicotinamide-nucleotide amidase